MRHAKLLIVLCTVAVISFTVLCVRAVFSVSDIVVEYSVYDSVEAERTDELLNRYYGSSLLFLKTSEVGNLIADNTTLKVESVNKKFPNKLEIKLKQRKEQYAVPVSDGYCILDDEYTVIDFRDSSINSNDGLGNIVLNFGNDEFDSSALKMRSQIDVGNAELLNAVTVMLDGIDSPRDYVTSVRLEKTIEQGNFRVYFTMMEGVEIEVRKVLERPEDKINLGFKKYLSLNDSEKLSGKVAAYQLADGEIVAVYTKQ